MLMWPLQTAARRSGHATDRGLVGTVDPGRATRIAAWLRSWRPIDTV